MEFERQNFESNWIESNRIRSKIQSNQIKNPIESDQKSDESEEIVEIILLRFNFGARGTRYAPLAEGLELPMGSKCSKDSIKQKERLNIRGLYILTQEDKA